MTGILLCAVCPLQSFFVVVAAVIVGFLWARLALVVEALLLFCYCVATLCIAHLQAEAAGIHPEIVGLTY